MQSLSVPHTLDGPQLPADASTCQIPVISPRCKLDFVFLWLKNCSVTPVPVKSKWLPVEWQAARSSPVHSSRVPSSVTGLLLFLPVTSLLKEVYLGHNCFFTGRSWRGGVRCEFPQGDSDSLPLLPGQQMGLATLSCSLLHPVRSPRTSPMLLVQCRPSRAGPGFTQLCTLSAYPGLSALWIILCSVTVQ